MSDIEHQMRFLAGSYGGGGHCNAELADVFKRGADEIATLRSAIYKIQAPKDATKLYPPGLSADEKAAVRRAVSANL